MGGEILPSGAAERNGHDVRELEGRQSGMLPLAPDMAIEQIAQRLGQRLFAPRKTPRQFILGNEVCGPRRWRVRLDWPWTWKGRW